MADNTNKSDGLDMAKKMMDDIKNLDDGFITSILVVIIAAIILSILFYYLYMRNLSSRECSLMNSMYQENNTYITSLNYENERCMYTLKDYYIMTAYNACSGGSYKNDFVGLCPLQNIIKQGVRGLDFEIYSINDQPVVSTSTVSSYYIKETYNYVPFSDVINLIKTNAFTAADAPNYEDPIIIHLRIKSNNQKMLSNLAKIFSGINTYLLGTNYSFEYNTCEDNQCYARNFGDVTLKELNTTEDGRKRNSIILIVDKSNTAVMENKELYEYVNMTSGSMFMRKLNYYDVRYTPDMNELQNYNKKNMTISVPDDGISPENPSGIITREMGCQLLSIRYQEYDEITQENISFFDKEGFAFALKPERLRYKEIVIEATPENPPQLNFETRSTSSDYYSFDT
jgi:hypothetical protein